MQKFKKVSSVVCLFVFLNSFLSQTTLWSAPTPGSELERFKQDSVSKDILDEDRKKEAATVEFGGAPAVQPETSVSPAPLPQFMGETADEVSFIISEISLPENEAISSQEVEKLVKPIEGREISLSEVLSLTDNLGQLYNSASLINRISSTDAKILETEVGDQLTFIIQKINIGHNDLLPAEDIQRIVEPFEGKQVTLYELSELANNLDQLYTSVENVNRLAPLDGSYEPKSAHRGGFGGAMLSPIAAMRSPGARRQSENARRADHEPSEMAVPTEDVAFLVEKFVLTGNTIFSSEELHTIVAPYEGKELKLAEVKQVAELVTKYYRSKGYITCRAYIPPQKLDTKTIEIRILEGKLGKVKVQGNRFFSSDIISRFMKKSVGQVLNYKDLKANVTKMNLHPDREVKAIVVPGKQIGTSDLVLDVEDKLPYHIGGEINNFGTELTGKERYSVSVRHTNLTGNDDILALRSQWGEHVFGIGTQYLIPVGPYDTQFGATFNYTDVKEIGGDFSVLDIAGEAYSYGFFVNQPTLDTEHVDLTYTAGFESKSIDNSILSEQSSKDEIRLLKTGLNIDEVDRYGRTFMTNDFIWGVPWLGASDKNDPKLSRDGAGSGFFKYVMALNRVHPLWWEYAYLLLKGSAQMSSNKLVSAEQYDIGGVYSVRGYPQSDYLGDGGLGGSAEVRIPFYFVPRETKVPRTDVALWNRLNFVGFIDTAYASLRNPVVGEQASNTFAGAGVGVRFDFPNNFVGRLEWGFPFGDEPTDGSNSQFYFSVSGDIF